MLARKVNIALKLVSADWQGSAWIHPWNYKWVREKTSKTSTNSWNTISYDVIENVLPSYFDSIDESTIIKAACLTKGACGFPQKDADQFQHIHTSTTYKKERKFLRTK